MGGIFQKRDALVGHVEEERGGSEHCALSDHGRIQQVGHTNQEESRSISENVTWGQRKRFSDGKVDMPYTRFLGYKKGAGGKPEVVPEEAWIVKRIYHEFLRGGSYHSIARGLTKDGIKSPGGKITWLASTVKSILRNKKYKGDALLQKRFTVDFLTKKQKVNEGEVPQYYVTNSHEAIVSEEIFAMTQHEIESRSKKKNVGSSVNFFSGRIICGCCGQPFTRKVWHSTSKYKRYIWQCGKKYKGGGPCTTAHLSEDEIKGAFLKLVNQLTSNRTEVLAICREVLANVLNTDQTKKRVEIQEADLQQSYDELYGRLLSRAKQSADTAAERLAYEEDIKRYEDQKHRLEECQAEIKDKERRSFACENFMQSLSNMEESINDFREELWLSLVDYVCVPACGEKRLIFQMRNGDTITHPVE